MNGLHSAKYLVLYGPEQSPRALLFSGEHRYLAERFDDEDGLMLDNLIRHSSKLCAPPCDLLLDQAVPRAELMSDAPVRCFALGGTAS